MKFGFRKILHKNKIINQYYNKKDYDTIYKWIKYNKLDVDIKENVRKLNNLFPNISEDIKYHCVNYFLFAVKPNHENVYEMSDFTKKRLDYLNSLVLPEQRTKEWFEDRKDKITASIVGSILGLCKYSNRDDMMYKKITKPFFSGNKYTEHGVCFEEIVTRVYADIMNVKVREYGLIPHDKHRYIGASPDGISNKGIMLEIKCPTGMRNFGNIFHKDVMGYLCQMQLQLNTCRLPFGDFIDCYVYEYDSKQECENDNNSKYRGVIGKFQHKKDKWGKNKYVYAKIKNSISEQENEIKFHYENHELFNNNLYDFKLMYYYVDNIVIHRIKRNKKWFNNFCMNKLDNFNKEYLERKDSKNIDNLNLKQYIPDNKPSFLTVSSSDE